MKLILGALVAGGTLIGADLPNPSWDECVIIDPIITTEEPTFISPEPAAISMQIIVYCGQRIPSESGPDINRQAFKYINVDLDQAEVLVRAAADLLGDDGVFPPE